MGDLCIAEIMDNSVENLKKRFKSVCIYAVGYGALMLFIGFVLFFVSVFAILLLIGSQYFVAGAVGWAVFAALILLVASASLSINTGFIMIGGQEYQEEEVDALKAIKYSLKCIPKIMVLILLEIMALLPVLVLIALFIYFLAQGLQTLDIHNVSEFIRNMKYVYLILIAFWALVLIFAFMVFSTFFIFAIHVLAIEKKGPVYAIKRSIFLVRHNFWRVRHKRRNHFIP